MYRYWRAKKQLVIYSENSKISRIILKDEILTADEIRELNLSSMVDLFDIPFILNENETYVFKNSHRMVKKNDSRRTKKDS